jgi:hypothetical protein
MEHTLGKFGDRRLAKAGILILSRMVSCESMCLRRLGGNRAGEEQGGRFLGNPKVGVAEIIESWSARTPQAVTGRHVLAIQDTTAIAFAHGKNARTRGLGPLNQGDAHGLLAHVMLAIDADTEACLGLVGGSVWNRPGRVQVHRHQRPLHERESRRWLDTAETARAVLAPAAMVTVVGDRESDLYPFWARVPACDDRPAAPPARLGWNFASARSTCAAPPMRRTAPCREGCDCRWSKWLNRTRRLIEVAGFV